MSLSQKIQDNKGVLIALGGLAVAGAAFFLAKKHGCCAKKQETSCCKGKCPVQSIYERLGGKVNIDAAVVSFYDKVLKDDRVKRFFKNTDMKHQVKQQQNFLCLAFGGPNNYVGKNMVDAHTGMNISSEEYDVIVELLGKTLIEMGVPTDLVNEVAAACEPLRKDIILK